MYAGKLAELLVAEGLITQKQLEEALEHKNRTRTALASSLVQLGHINENVLATFLSRQYGIPAISLDDVSVPQELTKLIPWSLCEKHHLVPLGIESNRIAIALSDPASVSAVDDVRFLCNRDVNVYLSTESAIKGLIDKTYGKGADENRDAPISATNLSEFTSGDSGMVEVQAGEEPSTLDVGESAVGDKPVIRLINKILDEAIKRKCSDIHIEPYEEYSRVRFRVDGSLIEVMRLPAALRTPTPARIKVMAQLDISEKRLPQDGRIQVKTRGKKVDVRVSTLPTMFGEKVVMRVLDAGSKKPDLLALGFEQAQYAVFQKAATQPYGMILVTGPTGSGKSTTLYGALTELNTPDVNISTVEDPVEYQLTGVNQVQMKESIGLNFAAALRSLLRQDPDIVMVGEIRDQETAEIAVKAALTGHLVFSTLHTNDAPSTITRLLHMGLEPFLITAALTLVQAQRLVRVNCPHCSAPDPAATKEVMREAEMPEHWLDTAQPMKGMGCDKCGNSGYKGRKGIFEVMMVSERLRSLIVKGANSDELRKAATEEGLISLRQSGLLKLYRGETSLEEVLNNSRPDGDIMRKT